MQMDNTLVVTTKPGRKPSITTQLRIKKANELLLTTNLTLKQIADTLDISLVTLTRYRLKIWPNVVARAQAYEKRRVRLKKNGAYDHISKLTQPCGTNVNTNISELKNALHRASTTVNKFQ
jgi:hypothetical protein